MSSLTKLEKKPKDCKQIDDGMSNFDHTVDDGVEKRLKKGNFFCQYAGYDFCGYVWRNKEKWSCEVWKYNSHVDTIHGDTLEEIMSNVSGEFGYD